MEEVRANWWRKLLAPLFLGFSALPIEALSISSGALCLRHLHIHV